jgi:hypothetical protein
MKKKKVKETKHYDKIRITVSAKEKALIKKETKKMGFIYMSDYVRLRCGL